MIGENIRKIRKAKGMSIMELREKTGLSKSTISDLENGKSSPTVDTLIKLAEAMNVDVKTFFEEITKIDEDYIHSTSLSSVYYEGLMKWSEDKLLKKYETTILRGHMAELFLRYKELIEKFVNSQVYWRNSKEDFLRIYKQRENPLSDIEIKELFLKQELENQIENLVSWIRSFPGWVARNEAEYLKQTGNTTINENSLYNGNDTNINLNIILNAAHEIEGASEEDKAHDDAIMDDENF